MLPKLKIFAAVIFCCVLTVCISSVSVFAQDHVVPAANLNRAMMSSAAARQKNISSVEKFLSSQPVSSAVKKSGYNLKEVQQAVPSLNDQELARLARTTSNIQNRFAAGALTHKQVTLIIVAAVVVIIILALKA